MLNKFLTDLHKAIEYWKHYRLSGVTQRHARAKKLKYEIFYFLYEWE